MEGPRRPRSGWTAATLPVLPHAGRTERGPAYQAIEPAGQVLPAGRAVHPAPLGYSRVRRRFDRLGRPAVGRDYDTTSLPEPPRSGNPLPSESSRPDGPTEARLLQRCRRRVGHRCICRGERPPAPEPGRPGKRNGLPAPPAGQMAKFRKASTKRLAQTAGTMFCREFG